MRKFFKDNSDIAGVIHFAASKAVNESIENPLLYYNNNVNSLTRWVKLNDLNFDIINWSVKDKFIDILH